jgi:uncharacterized protein DUF5666
MIEEDAFMNTRSYRLLALVAVAAALALPAAALAATHAGVNRGVVQSVDSSHIAVTALDGSTITFETSPRLVVRLNGRPASLGEITPGLVADVAVDPKGRAVLIKAFGGQANVTERGVVTAVSKSSVTISAPGGPKTVAFDKNTHFKVQGGPGKRGALRVGVSVAVTHAPDGPAQVVNVLKRAGA